MCKGRNVLSYVRNIIQTSATDGRKETNLYLGVASAMKTQLKMFNVIKEIEKEDIGRATWEFRGRVSFGFGS